MTNDLVLSLQNFLQEEKIEMNVWEASSSEFWLLNSNDSVAARFLVDRSAQEICYDVFSSEEDKYLQMDTVKDAENIESSSESHRKWSLAKVAEDLYIVLDKVKLLAQKHNFEIKEKEIV